MAVQTPPFSQFNLGQAYSAGQDIKYNRMRNEAAGMELQQEKDMLRNRKQALEIRQTYDGMPEQIEKMEERGLMDEADKLRQHYIDARMREVKILDATRKGLDEDNYKPFRQEMIQAGAVTPEMMPVEYSDKWWLDTIQEKKGNLSRLTRKWAEKGSIFTQDLIQQDGNIMWTGDPYQNPKDQAGGAGGGAGGGKPFQMKAADSNSIRQHVRSLYGSNFNPSTGKFDVLNRKEENEVAAIQAEASRIYNANNGLLPHAESVARAARKLQIEIRDLKNDPQNENPLGLPLGNR